jgi:hypothetical protein
VSEETPEETAASQSDLLFQARRRGLIALAATALIGVVVFFSFHGTGDLVDTGGCKVTSECEGMIGVECLHAPTGNYCTHSCNRNEDCDPSFHCESPPWEKETTRLVCLRSVPPAVK